VKIRLSSVMVKDQDRALKFYTEVLGFVKKRDQAVGGDRWLTVVSPAAPDGAELLLAPMGFPPARTFQEALREAGIPHNAFAVRDVQRAYERMKELGVEFTMTPATAEGTTVAVFDDTCGNLIMILQP
jgi:catechol 2,3-dioxygenase-like lactoylglutathione lyase family enzyme